jgi:protein-disulfide isomerase/uncharacterized membrane protein
MPKNRHSSEPSARHARADTGSPQRPISLARLAMGIAGLVIAIIASVMLVSDSLGLFTAPGCGEDGGCDKAVNGPLGSIEIFGTHWPSSFLGMAFFIAMLVTWIASRRRGVSIALVVMATLGGLASVFYIGAMVAGGYFCIWCTTAHAGNFLFIGAAIAGGGFVGAIGRPVGIAGVTFAAATVLLGVGRVQVETYLEEQRQADEDQTLAEIRDKVEEDRQQAATVAEDDDDDVADPAGQDPVNDDDDDADVATAVDADETPPDGWMPDPVEPEVAVQSDAFAFSKPLFKTDEEGFTGRYRIGPKEAPVRLVVFSSYECEFCSVLEREIFEILEEYDGVSFSHMHYTFDKDAWGQPCNPYVNRSQHPQGCEAATIAEAAGLLYGPEGFWRVHKMLFDVRYRIRQEPNWSPDMNQELSSLGYNPAEILRVARSEQTWQYVRDGIEMGQDLGLRQTPMIFLNGVEVTGWNRVGALKRIVGGVLADDPPALSPEADTPAGAIDKYIEDFLTASDRMEQPIASDAVQNFWGNPDAPLGMQVFMCMETPETAGPMIEALRTLHEQYPEAVKITFRHFPLNEDCNPMAETMRSANSCSMHKAMETAGRLGGNEAFLAMLGYINANRSGWTRFAVRDAAARVGLDPDEFLELYESPEVAAAVLADADWLFNVAKYRALRPIVFVSGTGERRDVFRRVDRFAFEGDTTSVLEGIIRTRLGSEDD